MTAIARQRPVQLLVTISLAFFAPEPRYLHSATANEFKAMVNQFHAHGIEMILDVVYNHTAEAMNLGNAFVFKGIDNASYYRLMPEQKRYYITTLVQVHTSTSRTSAFCRWSRIPCATGRPRCASTACRFRSCDDTGREPYGFDEGGGFLDACPAGSGAIKRKTDCRPWDIGPGGYQVGQFPRAGRSGTTSFAIPCAAFWKGDAGVLLISQAHYRVRATIQQGGAQAMGQR